MSALTVPAEQAIGRAKRVSFPRILNSERIKFTSLRSTYWTAGVMALFALSFAGTMLLGILVAPATGSTAATVIVDTFGERPALQALAFSSMLSVVFVAILAVLIVSTERASGLMNATIAAVPSRTPVLAAKILLSSVAGFVLAIVSSVLSFVVLQPGFSANGFHAALWDADVLQVLLGGAVYFAFVGAISTAIASMFRSTASGAGVVLGLLLFAPGLVGLIPAGIGTAIANFLPSTAGMMLYQPADQAGWTIILTGLLILVGWVIASSALAAVLLKRRDV